MGRLLRLLAATAVAAALLAPAAEADQPALKMSAANLGNVRIGQLTSRFAVTATNRLDRPYGIGVMSWPLYLPGPLEPVQDNGVFYSVLNPGGLSFAHDTCLDLPHPPTGVPALLPGQTCGAEFVLLPLVSGVFMTQFCINDTYCATIRGHVSD
jgi:hypothetical protein